MKIRILVVGAVLALAAPLASAEAATGASHRVLIEDSWGPNNSSYIVSDANMSPPQGRFVDLVKIGIVADTVHQTVQFDFVSLDEITSKNCPRNASGPMCWFYIRFDGVSPKTDYKDGNNYSFRLYPWAKPGAQVAVVHRDQDPSFVRNLPVLSTYTSGHHMVATISTARFLDAQLRYSTVYRNAEYQGLGQAISHFYGPDGKVVQVIDYANNDRGLDLLVR